MWKVGNWLVTERPVHDYEFEQVEGDVAAGRRDLFFFFFCRGRKASWPTPRIWKRKEKEPLGEAVCAQNGPGHEHVL